MSAVWVVSWARAAAMISRCEAEALGDVEAGGGSGDAQAQLVGGREGLPGRSLRRHSTRRRGWRRRP